MIVGVIYDPYRDEMFSALKGNGAYLNDEPITTDNAETLSQSLIATGCPCESRALIVSILSWYIYIFAYTWGQSLFLFFYFNCVIMKAKYSRNFSIDSTLQKC